MELSVGEIAIFFAIIGQTGAGFFWAGKITQIMQHNKEQDGVRDNRLNSHAKSIRKLEIKTGVGD